LKTQRINCISLGCSKNLVDSEVLMGKLKAARFKVVFEDTFSPGDVVIINTCGFIKDAKEESIDAVLNAIEAKKKGIVVAVYVMGCLTERYREEIQKEIPEADGIFGVNQMEQIISQFDKHYPFLPSERMLTTPPHYAYLKIAEGCDRTCAFCAIPLIRGRHISQPIDMLADETKILAEKGVKELIIIAQDVSYYGIDIYKKRKLAALLEKLIAVNGIEWIRLQYLYPAAFPMDVVEIMQSSAKICKYFDLPLQHISDSILKRMQRNITQKETYQLIENLRTAIPEAALRTTIITGFPGETEQDFQELLHFIRDIRFDRLGVFIYSPEEDTHAFRLKDDVPEKIKMERADEIMRLQQQISLSLNTGKIGREYKVLFDRTENNILVGRTEFDSPEVDNEVLVENGFQKASPGSFAQVKITSADDFDLFGQII